VVDAGFAVLLPVHTSPTNRTSIVYPVGESGMEPTFHSGDPAPAMLFLDELVAHVRSNVASVRRVFLVSTSGGSIFAWLLLLDALRRDVPPFFSVAAMISGYWFHTETFEAFKVLHHNSTVAVYSAHSKADEYLPYNGQYVFCTVFISLVCISQQICMTIIGISASLCLISIWYF
jgi:hypothetical protein